jgi:simple sugar transport system substrate-binding protein
MFHFAISQQPQYQGRLSVLFASLYATTGQTLAKVDGQRSELSSGPLLVTIDDIPATSFAMDRTSINIKVLTHDLVSDPFWDTIYAGMNQAADDFGVQLGTHRFKSAVSGRGEVSLERAFFIGEACRSVDIDGLIVSLPHENMVEALSECRARGIPVLALNAAPQEAIGLNLQYVGQMDYQSGREAGKKLLSTNVKRGWCLIHADLSSLKDRCRGMEDVFSGSNEAEYMGIVRVDTNQEDYKIAVETTLGDGNWTDLGILSTGQIQISSLLSVLQDHPELKAGTFDVDPKVDSNLLVFAIDQQPYLQGYTAVAMMTWSVTTSDTTTSGTFSTGPKFDVSAPTQERRKCGETNFAVCQPRAPFPTLKYSGKCAEWGRPCENCEGAKNRANTCRI